MDARGKFKRAVPFMLMHTLAIWLGPVLPPF